ncbi:MAG: pilus assembly protein PilM [Pseudomonadota bacterium]|nr:pilus assembly protein PilM [Pseudomonadota bacterium]
MTMTMTTTSLLQRWRDRAAPAHPIGVDFAAESLNMLQIAQSGSGPLVRAAVSLPYPLPRAELLADARALKAFVRGALASAPFSGTGAVAALAPADVRILPLTVIVPNGQQEQQAVARAVREQLGAQAAESVVDYYQVRSADAGGNERQVLAAVAPRTKVTAYLDSLRSAGLAPSALDIGPTAIARLLAAMHENDHDESVLLINFGVHKSFLTVIWGRRLMLDREIDFGEMQLVDKLAKALNLAPDLALGLLHEHGTAAAHQIGRTIGEILYPEFAALAEELLRTQVYVASRTRGSAVSRVYLNGSAARYAHTPERVAAMINLPVEVLDPFKAFGAIDGFTPQSGVTHGIALAAGLALRGVQHG